MPNLDASDYIRKLRLQSHVNANKVTDQSKFRLPTRNDAYNPYYVIEKHQTFDKDYLEKKHYVFTASGGGQSIPPDTSSCNNGLRLITSGTFVGKYEDLDHIVYSDCSGTIILGYNANILSLTELTIPDRVISIVGSAFYGCTALQSLTLGTGLISIGELAFSNCNSLLTLNIPNNVTTIGHGAFYYCSVLTSLTLSNGLTTIEYDTFNECNSLTSITIPNSVTSIGNSAFALCYNLSTLNIGNNVESIGQRSFYRPYLLASITIPKSVTSFGSSTFGGCNSLSNLTFETPTGLVNGSIPTGLGIFPFIPETPRTINVYDAPLFIKNNPSAYFGVSTPIFSP